MRSTTRSRPRRSAHATRSCVAWSSSPPIGSVSAASRAISSPFATASRRISRISCDVTDASRAMDNAVCL